MKWQSRCIQKRNAISKMYVRPSRMWHCFSQQLGDLYKGSFIFCFVVVPNTPAMVEIWSSLGFKVTFVIINIFWKHDFFEWVSWILFRWFPTDIISRYAEKCFVWKIFSSCFAVMWRSGEVRSCSRHFCGPCLRSWKALQQNLVLL